jgi:HAD superfamily hydrolase (TIGR01509 family)
MLVGAVIFDMDGLMLDTEPLYRAAWQNAAAKCGYVISDAIYFRLIGRTRGDSEQILVDEFGHQFPISVFRSACQECETETFKAGPLPKKHGLDELLTFLDARHIPKAVATSTVRQEAFQLLSSVGLLARFDVVTTGEEVASGKPSPDIFVLAARRLGIDHSACLVLEDSELGVIAAHRAEMKVFIVPDLKVPSESVTRLANGTFNSLAAVTKYLELTVLSS